MLWWFINVCAILGKHRDGLSHPRKLPIEQNLNSEATTLSLPHLIPAYLDRVLASNNPQEDTGEPAKFPVPQAPSLCHYHPDIRGQNQHGSLVQLQKSFVQDESFTGHLHRALDNSSGSISIKNCLQVLGNLVWNCSVMRTETGPQHLHPENKIGAP